MTDWEVTATTIYCDAVDDEVTIIVQGDGAVKCTGLQKYAPSNKESAKELKKKGKALHKTLACEGIGCPRVVKHRAGLMSKQ
jgi:hypothetical protein